MSDETADNAAKGGSHSWIGRIVTLAILIAAGAGAYYYYTYSEAHPSTKDAYVGANIVHVASQVTGRVTKVPAETNTRVKSGDLLVQLDPAEFIASEKLRAAQVTLARQEVATAVAAVAAAKAEVASQEAVLKNAQDQYTRVIALVKQGDQSDAEKETVTSTLDQARAAVAAARARLVEAEANVGQTGASTNARIDVAEANLTGAKLTLTYAETKAPSDGTLGPVTLRPGDFVEAGQSLFPLVEDGTWYITANFKETDLHRIQPGMTAQVTIDMYPDESWTGTVESLSPASGAAFSLLPPENATGNWVKVTQRFPVRIAIRNDRPDAPLRVGASATVVIETDDTDKKN